MKIYNKPEITIEKIGIKEAISTLDLSNGKVANFDNIPQDSWHSWQEFFE